MGNRFALVLLLNSTSKKKAANGMPEACGSLGLLYQGLDGCTGFDVLKSIFLVVLLISLAYWPCQSDVTFAWQ